ncbi:MAG: Ig-like domain-containing protein [Myxococcales bacterium]|nr:Ig-like domain-containing protein [Myxococcales bacterium]
MKSPSTTKNAAASWAVFTLLGLAGVGWSACARVEHGGVEIVTEGVHSVEVGASIELVAQTVRGTDHAYTWSSEDESIATVSAAGIVTGVAAGEVLITVEGDDTAAIGEHVVVVLAVGGGSEDTGGQDTGEGSTSSETGEPPEPDDEVPFEEQWRMSAHADATAEAFNHWNEDGEIPQSCARCHSREGFRDYLGDDGSEVAIVNQPAPTGSVVDCQTCHNDAATKLDWVIFPSGETVTELGAEARCMTCHQGRGSTDSVDATITAAGVGDDEVSDALSFQNIHYFPTAATLFAGRARGGYQYADQVYDRRFRHVPGYDSCVGCHDPHSTQPRFDGCVSCHDEAVDAPGVRQVRMIASRNVDYDGDGDTSVGIYYEVKGLEEKLYRAIQAYASGVVGQTICYSPQAYPYWFDSATGATAECTEAEATGDNAYAQWTPRLVRAAYNYQMARKDPGAYVHNGRYIIKLLHDSIVDLNGVIAQPIDMSQAQRDAPGHFNGASEAARHWDEDEAVSASCSKCHSGAPGFRFYVEYGVGVEVPETANGLECYTCHESFEDEYAVLEVGSTTYANGVELSHEGYDNICATCHSGRQAGASVDGAIASGNLSFRNVHYLPAAGVRNGNESGVGYEYAGAQYAGFLEHDSRTQCTGCHDPVISNHTFRIADVWDSVCDVCHSDQSGPEEIRLVHLDDYDGDGNTGETLRGELQGLANRLLLQIVASAPSPICYGDNYPYWLGAMGDASGHCPPDAQGSYSNWTPGLVRATYNFQLHHVEPGAYAHNFEYMAQLLHDSIEDLGGDVSGLVRP